MVFIDDRSDYGSLRWVFSDSQLWHGPGKRAVWHAQNRFCPPDKSRKPEKIQEFYTKFHFFEFSEFSYRTLEAMRMELASQRFQPLLAHLDGLRTVRTLGGEQQVPVCGMEITVTESTV